MYIKIQNLPYCMQKNNGTLSSYKPGHGILKNNCILKKKI